MSTLFVTFLTVLTVSAWPNPQTFVFDPAVPEECADGIPRMTGPIPFLPNTPLNDDHIGLWIKRHTECLFGNYYNNIKTIDYSALMSNVIGPNWSSCYLRTDGAETCFTDFDAYKKRVEMVRDVLDVIGGVTELIEVGHTFDDYMVETFVFNDDGTTRKSIEWTEDELNVDLIEWAETALSGFGDYLKVDHVNRGNYYQIDLGDTGVRFFIGFVIFWLLFAPIGMVWIAMKICKSPQKQHFGDNSASEFGM